MRLIGLDPSPARSRQRLRHGPDLSPAGIVVAAVVIAIFALDVVQAASGPPPAAISAIDVAEADELDVTVAIEGDRAPTFQVYPQAIGTDGAVWVVELPGATVPPTPLVPRGAGAVLREARVEPAARGAPARVVLTFADEVDFDARTDRGTLRVRFTPTGDRGALLSAHRRRQEVTAQLAALQQAEAARVALEQKQAEEARVAAAEAARLEEEQRRADEERRLALARVAEERQRAEETRIAEEARRAEEQRLAEKQRRADEKRDALERQRADRARAAEEARLARATRKAERLRLAEERRRAANEARAARESGRRRPGDAQVPPTGETSAEVARAKLAEETQRLAAQKAAETRQAEEAQQAAAARKTEEARRLEEARALEVRRLEEARALEARLRAEEARLLAEKKATEEARAARAQKLRDDQRRTADEHRRALDAARAAEGLQRERTEAFLRTRRLGGADDFGFGGDGVTGVELSRPVRYLRWQPPPEDEVVDDVDSGDDGFGGGGDEDSFDEHDGRSVLSKLTVQRTAQGARLGVVVDGGARYDVQRRRDGSLLVTLFGTRAASLGVRRVLDARALGVPILRVLPSVDEGDRFRVRLLVETHGAGTVSIAQDGRALWVEVTR